MVSQIFVAIVATIVAMGIWEICGRIFPKIKTPVGLLLSFFYFRKIVTFSNFNDDKIKKYIDRGIEKSKKLKYMSIRGFPLVQEAYELHKALKKYYNVDATYQFMISDPNGQNAKNRADEYAKLETSSNSSLYLDEIRASITQILEQKKIMPKIVLKLHDTIPIFRICICDKYCFLSFYTSKYMGKSSPVFLFDNKTIEYDVFEYYFDYTWKNSHECTIKI